MMVLLSHQLFRPEIITTHSSRCVCPVTELQWSQTFLRLSNTYATSWWTSQNSPETKKTLNTTPTTPNYSQIAPLSPFTCDLGARYARTEHRSRFDLATKPPVPASDPDPEMPVETGNLIINCWFRVLLDLPVSWERVG